MSSSISLTNATSYAGSSAAAAAAEKSDSSSTLAEQQQAAREALDRNEGILKKLMDGIDLTVNDDSSPAFKFAKLQLAYAMLCKAQSETYMTRIEETQGELEKLATALEKARNLKAGADAEGDRAIVEKTYIAFLGEDNKVFCEDMTDEKWDLVINNLKSKKETVSNQTQTWMVYVQDFIGQYNSYLQGASTSISQGNQLNKAVATTV